MATSCGIHIDQRRFHLVALDGSVKKHKIRAHLSGEIVPGEDPVTAVSTAIRKIAKEKKLRGENVGLVVDSGLAAFRTLTLPFDDRGKIEDVLKFEIENDLPQWDIDEVIVDFIVLSTTPGVESHLLVTAIPKLRLERQLAACERAGMEANDAELDGTALFNAAHHAGLIAEGGAQILVHVGDSSTTVVVADEGKLVSIRAIRAGALPPLPSLFETADEEEEDEVEDEEDSERAAEDVAAVQARLEQTTQRIRRELGRTIAGIQSDTPIEAIYACGHELLTDESLFDVPVLPLDVLPVGEDSPTDQELTIAYGAALKALGGAVLAPHMRREELRFTGKFERLELPLAVFSLLLFTMLAVQYIVILKQINWRDQGTLSAEAKFPGDMQLWLENSNRYLLPNDEEGYAGRLKNPPPDLLAFIQKCEAGEVDTLTKYQEIQRIRFLLTEEIKKIQRDLGQVSDIKQPQSALRGMALVMDVINAMGDEIGRFGVRGLNADYRLGRSGANDTVEVRLDMDFFAESSLTATRHYKAMESVIENQIWCTDFSDRPTNPLDDGSGITVDSIIIKVNVEAAMAAEEQA
jgi:Tfp pilus assembly PilM family ATPase